MKFSRALECLRRAASDRNLGLSDYHCIVKREDLKELLGHFDRLDVKALQRVEATTCVKDVSIVWGCSVPDRRKRAHQPTRR